MNETWSKKWKKVLIWFCGWIDFVAFALVGGYTIVKSEDEDLKKTAKQTFTVVLIFAAISAFFNLINYIGGFIDRYSFSTFYEICTTITRLVAIAKIIVYAVFILMTLFKKEE